MNEKIKANMNHFEQNISFYACKNSEAIRFESESEDIRTPFFRDIDRIIYSLSYTRYIDKTQVFSFNENDNITKRMTHVQMVSKIARTIGRALGLNEDLIEAAALGHDLGHVPFGHPGEAILNKISLVHGEGYFNHNIQSVRNLMFLELNGQGRNLTIQVLDAIMCHNGEFLMGKYHPVKKTKEEFLKQYESSYKEECITDSFVPMTMEGCVVRISDIIGYIGKDIEDAIRLGVFDKKEIPQDIVQILGSDNKTIVNNIIMDIINNSIDKPYIKLSDKVFKALLDLKKFNFKNIYLKANTSDDLSYYEKLFQTVFDSCLNDLNQKNEKSTIYEIFLKGMSNEYLENTSKERIVIDYIAGMTDDFLVREYNRIVENKIIKV